MVTVSASAEMIKSIDKIKSSIVIVGTYKSTNSPRFGLRGTGFVVGNGNMAITNAHVLPEAKDADVSAGLVLQVKIGDDKFQIRPVTVLDIDVAHDLALLQFDGPALPAVSLGNSDEVREGQQIAFMGYPIGGALGFSPVTHRGMISSIAAAALPTPSSSQLNAKMIRSPRAGALISFSWMEPHTQEIAEVPCSTPTARKSLVWLTWCLSRVLGSLR